MSLENKDFSDYPHWLQHLRESRAFMAASYKDWAENTAMIVDRIPSFAEDPEVIKRSAEMDALALNTLDLGDGLPGGPPTPEELADADLMVILGQFIEHHELEGEWLEIRELIVDLEDMSAEDADRMIARAKRDETIAALQVSGASLDTIEAFLAEVQDAE